MQEDINNNMDQKPLGSLQPKAETQYIDLYESTSSTIKSHSADIMNKVRDKAFEDFKNVGFPTRKVERYKYTDMAKLFQPNYGLNLNRLDIPVNPYDAFKCDENCC